RLEHDLLVGGAVEVPTRQRVPDAGVRHGVVPTQVDAAGLESLGLERDVAERVGVAHIDTPEPVHHLGEVLEPGHEDVPRVDPDQVAHRATQQLRAPVVQRRVDLVVAVAGDVDPGVAGYADDARRVR